MKTVESVLSRIALFEIGIILRHVVRLFLDNVLLLHQLVVFGGSGNIEFGLVFVIVFALGLLSSFLFVVSLIL